MSRFRHACYMIAFLQICALALGGPPPAIPWKHDWERYEASLARNPFMTRTLPAVTDVGLADFALVAYYGALENPTLVVANIKTHERFRLKIGETAPAGFVIRSCQLAGPAEEKFVEVSKSGQQSKLVFAQAYVQQLAAKSNEQSNRLRQRQQNGAAVPASPGASPLHRTLQVSTAPRQTTTVSGTRTVATTQSSQAVPMGLLQAPEQNEGSQVSSPGDMGSAPAVNSRATPRPASAPGQRVLIPPISQ